MKKAFKVFLETMVLKSWMKLVNLDHSRRNENETLQVFLLSKTI